MNNFGEKSPLEDNEDDPNAMLVKRLINIEKESKGWKEAYYQCFDYLTIANDAIGLMIGTLPEPIVLREIADKLDNEESVLKQYLQDSATVIDHYKTALIATTTMKHIGDI